jgi:DNA-binding transcriptional regulator YiaG
MRDRFELLPQKYGILLLKIIFRFLSISFQKSIIIKMYIFAMDMESLLADAGITKEFLADSLEISETTVRNWLGGRTEPTLTPSKYQKLLNLLRCSPSQLSDACQESMMNRQKRRPGRRKSEV